MQTTLLAMLLCALLSGAAGAEQLLFDSAEDWASWTMPHDLIQVGTDGRLRLVKFRRDVNAKQGVRVEVSAGHVKDPVAAIARSFSAALATDASNSPRRSSGRSKRSTR